LWLVACGSKAAFVRFAVSNQPNRDERAFDAADA
jgi:hypothetical protein